MGVDNRPFEIVAVSPAALASTAFGTVEHLVGSRNKGHNMGPICSLVASEAGAGSVFGVGADAEAEVAPEIVFDVAVEAAETVMDDVTESKLLVGSEAECSVARQERKVAAEPAIVVVLVHLVVLVEVPRSRQWKVGCRECEGCAHLKDGELHWHLEG